MDLSLPLTDRHETWTAVWCGVKPENLPANVFTAPLKNLAGKTSNFAELPPTRRQSEAHNFKMAQNINKTTL